MSYILDALKKSEQEQARRRAPDIHAAHDAPSRRHAGTRRTWFPLVLANVVLAAALVSVFVLAPRIDPVGPGHSAAAPEAAGSVHEAPASVTAPPAFGLVTPGAGSLTFSSHIYASDPSLRAVTINGERFREGDHIDASLRLREITQDGVVLERNGESIDIAVLDDWTP